MEIVNNLLFWIHLMALVAGGAVSVTMPLIGPQMAGAAPETRGRLAAIAQRVVSIGRGAMVVLLITGPLLFWLKWNFTAANMTWFGIKMLLVLVLLAGMIIGGISMRRAQQGDASGMKRAQQMGMMNSVALVGIVLAAVFAFE